MKSLLSPFFLRVQCCICPFQSLRVEIDDATQDEEFLYLVMEYLPGGDVMVEFSDSLHS